MKGTKTNNKEVIELKAMKVSLLNKIEKSSCLDEQLRALQDINTINIKIDYHENIPKKSKLISCSKEVELP